MTHCVIARRYFCLLPFAFCLFLARAGDAALDPAIQAEPHSDGMLTWWLAGQNPNETLDKAKPPLDAREGAAIAGTNAKWAVHIDPCFPIRIVDLRPFVGLSSGVVWSSARIHSVSGGKRRLRGGTYCGMRVFVDGNLVLDKPRPWGPRADEGEAEIEIPKGVCEISVAVDIRWSSAYFFLFLTESRAQGGRPQPVAGDRIVLPTAAGKPADSGSAAMQALSLLSDKAFITPGQPLAVGAVMYGSIPFDLGPLSARLLAPDGSEVATFSPQSARGQSETPAAARDAFRGTAQVVPAQD